MSIESAIEEKIRQAIERGEFDNLAGKGKPLDLAAYFNTPEDLRMAYSMLKSNQFVPEEVDLLKEISDLREHVRDCPDADEKAALAKKLNDKTLAFNVAIEKYKRKR
ncbi:MAG: DUF1992 domain-containing protein [Acidobacteriota bacterium]